MAVDLVAAVWHQHRHKHGTDWCRFCRKTVELKPVVGGDANENKCGECGACFRGFVLDPSEAFGSYADENSGEVSRGGEARMDRNLSEHDMLVDFLSTTRRARLHHLRERTHVIQSHLDAKAMEDESCAFMSRVESLARRVKEGCDAIRHACIEIVGGRFKPHVSSTAVEYWMALAAFISDTNALYKPMQWAAACLYLAGFQRNADNGFGFHLGELVRAFELTHVSHLRRAIRRAHKVLQASDLIDYAPPQKSVLCGVYLRRLVCEIRVRMRVRLEAVKILTAYCSSTQSRLATPDVVGLVSQLAPAQARAVMPYERPRHLMIQELPKCMLHLPLRIACACLSLASIVLRKDTDEASRQQHASRTGGRPIGVTQHRMERHLGLRAGAVSAVCGAIIETLRRPDSGYRGLDGFADTASVQAKLAQLDAVYVAESTNK